MRDYSKLSKKDLQKLAEENKLTYKSGDTKETLAKMLTNNEKKAEVTTETLGGNEH